MEKRANTTPAGFGWASQPLLHAEFQRPAQRGPQRRARHAPAPEAVAAPAPAAAAAGAAPAVNAASAATASAAATAASAVTAAPSAGDTVAVSTRVSERHVATTVTATRAGGGIASAPPPPPPLAATGRTSNNSRPYAARPCLQLTPDSATASPSAADCQAAAGSAPAQRPVAVAAAGLQRGRVPPALPAASLQATAAAQRPARLGPVALSRQGSQRQGTPQRCGSVQSPVKRPAGQPAAPAGAWLSGVPQRPQQPAKKAKQSASQTGSVPQPPPQRAAPNALHAQLPAMATSPAAEPQRADSRPVSAAGTLQSDEGPASANSAATSPAAEAGRGAAAKAELPAAASPFAAAAVPAEPENDSDAAASDLSSASHWTAVPGKCTRLPQAQVCYMQFV